MANNYEMQTNVRISARFVGVDGVTAADPTEVKLFVKPVSGAIVTYTLSGAQVVKDSVGNYHYDISTGIAPGAIAYKWQGTGAVVCTSPDGSLAVNGSLFAAQV